MSYQPKGAESASNSRKKPEASDQGAVGDGSSEATAEIHSDFPRIHRFWKRTKQVADFVGPTAFIIGVVFAIKAWMDFAITRRLGDEATLRKIAEHSRPSLILDAHESVVANMGALPFIDPKDIRVTKRTADGMPEHIHIGFIRQVSSVPILTSVHDPADITCERGRGLDWEFELAWDRIPVGKKDTALLFRLEVMP